MFLHLYKYRIITLLRAKETSFWIFLFPLALATLFNLAFGNINARTEDFNTIPVAVVVDNMEAEKSFTSVLESMENEGKDFFAITYADKEKATKLLNTEKVTGVITVKEGIPSLAVAENGLEESIIKMVLDRYIQTVDILSHAPMDPAIISQVAQNTSDSVLKIHQKKAANGTTDNFCDYYYALIAMTCLFGSFTGQVCSNHLKANRSTLGTRKTVSSTGRMAFILSDIAAALTLHSAANAILIAYLQFILKLNLGTGYLEILLISIVGSAIGINVGIALEAIPKLTENGRMGLSVAFSLFSSFLSGLMVGGIKDVIEHNIPFINRINPATLISNAIYSLNIYDNYDKFFQNIFTMIGMCIVLCILSYLLTRRESYDNL